MAKKEKKRRASKIFKSVLAAPADARIEEGEGSWFKMFPCVTRDPKLTDKQYRLYSDLRHAAGRFNRVTHSVISLAQKLGMDRRNLQRHMAALEARGLIWREFTSGGKIGKGSESCTIVFSPLHAVYGERADYIWDFDPSSGRCIKPRDKKTYDDPAVAIAAPPAVAIAAPLRSESPHPCGSNRRTPAVAIAAHTKKSTKKEKKRFSQRVPPTAGGRFLPEQEGEDFGEVTSAEKAAPVSRAEKPVEAFDLDDVPKHTKAVKRNRRGAPTLFNSPSVVKKSKLVSPVPPRTWQDVFALFKTETRKRWSEAHLPVNLDPKSWKMLERQISNCYESRTILEMVRVLVWDWESLRKNVWPHYPDQHFPAIKNLCEYRDTLSAAIGKGHCGDAEHRVSKYYERYCVKGGQTQPTSKRPGFTVEESLAILNLREEARKKSNGG